MPARIWCRIGACSRDPRRWWPCLVLGGTAVQARYPLAGRPAGGRRRARRVRPFAA